MAYVDGGAFFNRFQASQKRMTAEAEKNGLVQALSPPTDEKLKIKNGVLLILEIVWLTLLILPLLLLSLFRKIFPGPGKTLSGQVVLVTGAGRGLGRGLAIGFAREGCKVAVADVNRATAEETAAEIVNYGGVAKVYLANVAKLEEVKAMRKAITEELGDVDILVNNAGLIHGGALDLEEDDNIRAVISVNLTSHFWMVREFLPAMKERNSGHIVAICSVAGLVGVSNGAPYVASKFGVRGLMDVVRSELEATANNQIKTTIVYPYFINTSAHYVDHWDLRLPAMPISEVVEATLTGIKRNEVTVTIPGYLYPLLHLNRLLPQYVMDKSSKIFHVRITPTTAEEKKLSPTTAIVRDLIQHADC